MRVEITLAEFKEPFKGLGSPQDELFEMLRVGLREHVGCYSTELILMELTGFLGRECLNVIKAIQLM